jgi:beta-mannan synthase
MSRIMVATIVFAFLSLQCVSEATTTTPNGYLNITYQEMNSVSENVNHIQKSTTILGLIEKLSILLIIIQSSGDIEQIIYTILRLCLPPKSHPTLSNVVPSLSTDEKYPMVAVQLPMMNEKEFCLSMIMCACNLDWPKSRLIIQVLDDSTDEIVMAMIDQCVQEWFDRGYQINIVRRDNRRGFKAGNLKNGLEKIQQCEYIALFDVDFLPERNFLVKTIPILIKDPKAAYAQARWIFTNAKESLLTQMQEIVLNHHHKCEQEVKHRMSSFFQFNGSACVWRTKAIYECGGWQTDTLVEDLDISVRAYMNGWRSAYLVNVECLNELPPTFTAYLSQQYRWFSGPAQVFRKLFRKVCGTSHIDIYQKLHCLWMLFRPCLHIIRFATFLLNIAISACLRKSSGVNTFITFFPILLTLNILRYTPRQMHLTILYYLFCNAMLFHHATSAIAGFLNFSSAKQWVVTPKFGCKTCLNIHERRIDVYHIDNTIIQCRNQHIHSIVSTKSTLFLCNTMESTVISEAPVPNHSYLNINVTHYSLQSVYLAIWRQLNHFQIYKGYLAMTLYFLVFSYVAFLNEQYLISMHLMLNALMYTVFALGYLGRFE